jgi:RNA polymerase sigma-70 factor (ECF subfamily)
MLLHDSRRDARLGPDGEVVLLQEQDRSLWNQEQIREGRALAERALREAGPAPYPVQAAIAALHAEARRPEDTDWRQIAGLYDVLMRLYPSPVVELNRAVAVAQAYGAQAGLPLLDDLDARGELPAYHLLPAARADLLKTLGRFEEAAAAYRSALALVANEPERRFLERRLAEVEAGKRSLV